MKAEVTLDRTIRTISIDVSGVPDIDVTQHYHRKSRIFRPEKITITVVDGEVNTLKATGGLVLKSGAASDSVGESQEWRSDNRGYGLGDPIDDAPAWVKMLWNDAPLGVASWNAGEVQAL